MSHELNLDAFCSNPSVAELQTAKVTKDDLKYIARQFDLSYPSDIRKEELRTQILVHLGGEATSAASQHDASLMLELEKLKLMAAREEREAAREREREEREAAREREREEREAAREREREREERELRREELAFQKEKAERDLAYVKEKEEKEREEREKEREEREKEREEREKERIHETQLTQLKSRSTTTADLKQKLTKYLSLLPRFSDKDPETFFGQFEDTAVHFELPREDWPWLLKPKLSQKALTIVNGLENNTDYDCVKQGILAAYSITTEGYRQSFRKMFKTPQQTYLEFASEKLRALKRWLKSAAITTYDELVNLLALEEFMRKLPCSVMLHITNKEETDLLKAAQLADLFSLVNRKATSDKLTETPSGKINSGNSGVGKMTGSSTGPPLFCAFCKQPGHLIKNCPSPKCKVAQTYLAKPVASIQALQSFPVPKDLFEPFRSVGTISIDNKDHPVKIVRDTCSAQSLVLKSAVPGIEQGYTGEKVYLKDFHDPFPIALAKVHLDSPLVRGEVIIGVSEEPALPIPNAQLLLANDLAGSKVTPPLVISDTMLMDNPTVQLEEQQPGLFPVCVTTRAQARKSDQSFSLPKKSPSPLELNQIFSEKLLTEAQQEDTTLTQFHDKVIPPDQITHYPAFYKQDGVLMRVFRPSKVPDDDEVVEKVGDNNYIINTPDRRKATQLIHVNLLKMYKCRTPVTGAQPTPRVASCGIIEPQEADSELKPASVCSLMYDKCITTEIDTNTIHPKDTQNNTYIIQHLDDQLRHLSSSRALDISRLISQYDVFGDHPKICNVLCHDVKVLPGTFPIKQSPYRVNPRKREQMQKEVQYLLEQGLAIPSSSPWASPCLLVPKEDGQLRFCTDYRRVNAVTIPDAYPLPRVDDLIDEIQNVLSRLQEANLTVKLAKSTFGAATVSYLGHQIGQGSVRPKTANVDAVLKYPTPTTRRELRRFLGMAGFYRRFCPNFADAAGPLTRLTSGNVAYEWTPACQHAFNQLKNLLAREPVLRAADFSKPFIIHTDASDHASGAALLQESDGIFHPVAYHSEKFNIHQKNYSTIEKKLLAIISAIKKFEYYLQSNTQPLQIYTDHNPLTFLNRNRFTNQRLLRWSLQFQPYHIEMHHIKGLDNCLADTLSRLPTTPRITTRRDPEDPRILLPGMQSCLVNRSMEAAEGRALPEEPSTGPQTTHVLVESTFTGQEPPHFTNDAESFLLRHPKKGGMSHT
ncbi:uncharacterized protein LOC135092563 [Scylla paramamosain]|uniref:uncharacterized protein LOC135092563 n=1 Tax=Scylla paramamosain TaxID=85552 RepID=UPI00308354DC